MTSESVIVSTSTGGSGQGSGSSSRWLVACTVQAQRLLVRWVRMPEIMIQTLIFPAFLLLVLQLVLGDALTASAQHSSVYEYTALVAVAGTIYGSLSSGLSLLAEKDSGLLARLWTLPTGRATGIVARLLAECSRCLLSSIILFALGAAMGLRPERGVALFLVAMLVPVVLTVGVAALVTALTLSKAGRSITEFVGVLALIGIFFSTGFAPPTNYPEWLRIIVEWQPMSCGIDAMRGLLIDGPIALPLVKTAGWVVILAGGCSQVAVRGYQRAARGE